MKKSEHFKALSDRINYCIKKLSKYQLLVNILALKNPRYTTPLEAQIVKIVGWTTCELNTELSVGFLPSAKEGKTGILMRS